MMLSATARRKRLTTVLTLICILCVVVAAYAIARTRLQLSANPDGAGAAEPPWVGYPTFNTTNTDSISLAGSIDNVRASSPRVASVVNYIAQGTDPNSANYKLRNTTSNTGFEATGWRMSSSNSQLVIRLTTPIGRTESGAVEFDVSRFRNTDHNTEKAHVFSLYSWDRVTSSKREWRVPNRSWVNLSLGSEYGRCFKALWTPGHPYWASIETRIEARARCAGTPYDNYNWDPAKFYTWRIEYIHSSHSINVYVQERNSLSEPLVQSRFVRLFGPQYFAPRIADLNYVHVGRDSDAQVGYYDNIVQGPMYHNVRILRY